MVGAISREGIAGRARPDGYAHGRPIDSAGSWARRRAWTLKFPFASKGEGSAAFVLQARCVEEVVKIREIFIGYGLRAEWGALTRIREVVVRWGRTWLPR